jgi:hypothetical protein
MFSEAPFFLPVLWFRKRGFVDNDGGLRVHSSLLNILLHD